MNGGGGGVSALASLGQSFVGLFASVFQIGTALWSSIFVLAALVGVALLSVPITQYGDAAVESAVQGMVTTVHPLYINTLRPILSLGQTVYNPLICWWNALNWWGSGMIREVLWPTLRDCGGRPLFSAAGDFIKAVGSDVLVFLASGRFLTEYASFDERVTPAGIALSQAWIDLYTCACSDLGDVVRTLPITEPLLLLPPTWPVTVPLVFFSQQWTDPQTWCALESGFNAGVAAAQALIRLATQVLTFLFGNPRPGQVFERPDFRAIVDKLCPALACAVRSTENAYQVFWDRYVPFAFDFTDFLSLADTLGCIALKTVDLTLRVLIHIDECVLYPQNAFWERAIKPDVIELINLWAPPTPFDPIVVPAAPAPPRYTLTHYYLDTESPIATNLLLANPVYGKRRVTDALCITLTRLICAPGGGTNSSNCFPAGADNLLMGIDFCCTTTAIGTTLADTASAMFELTLHFAKGADELFLTIDAQPFTTLLSNDLVVVARCALAIVRLIPVAGTSLRDLLVGLIEVAAGLADIAFRLLMGIATLPYYIIVMPDVSNYVQRANVALDQFVAVTNQLNSDAAGSVRNSLCFLVNNAFPVPPIPCGSCVVGGFVPPLTTKRGEEQPLLTSGPTRRTFFDAHGKDINSPMALVRELWGGDVSDPSVLGITPLIRYDNHTTNPIELFNMMYVNVQLLDPRDVLPFPTLRSVDEFVDQKKADIMRRWARVKQCNRRADEAQDQLRKNPRAYAYRNARGDFRCDGAGEPLMHAYQAPPARKRVEYNYSAPAGDLREVQTLGPLEPTLVGCSPTPQCFDLCCLPRSLLVVIVHLAQMLARFINGLAQGGAGLQGTVQDFPYFTVSKTNAGGDVIPTNVGMTRAVWQGEFANLGRPTFESDLITLILLAFRPIRCLCQVLNLIIPVTPTEFTLGRPDICCAVQRISELLASIIQVIINAINALAMGGTTNFIYFRGGFFRNDVNALFDISLAVVECLCIFARAVFPFTYISSVSEATDFDVCCGPSVILDTLVELGRLLLAAIISLATISVDTTTGEGNAFCYWRLDHTADPTRRCGGSLDEIGIVKQIDVVLDTFFPLHAGDPKNPVSSVPTDCSKTCNLDNGQSGIVPCACQLLNTLIPFRDHPERPVSCSANETERNCQRLDMCCPLGKTGFLLSDLTKFVSRLVVSAWQPWADGLPEFLIHYIFCSEFLAPQCPDMQIKYPNPCDDIVNAQTPQCEGIYPVLNSTSQIEYRCGKYTCGKFNIVIADIVHPFDGLIAKCTCEILSLLDLLIAMLYNLVSTYIPQAGWACCFCGGQTEDGLCNARFVSMCAPGAIFRPTSDPQGGSGILPAVSFIVQAVAVSLTDLQRKFPLPCYWHPVPVGETIPTQLRETWIFNFLGPVADALAIATGNTMCIATSTFFLPPVTIKSGERFLGSIIRWVAEIIIRVVAFVEAFVQTLIASSNACVGSKDACEGRQGAGRSTKGVNSKKLGKMLVILLSIPIDILIGDSQVACTTVCPSIFAVPTPKPCECWNLSPLYGGGNGRRIYEWVADADATGNGVCKDYSQDAIDNFITRHVGTPFGTNTSGAPYVVLNPNGTLFLPLTTLGAGCCKLINASLATPGGPILPALPICQNPDDGHDANTTYAGDPGYPGSCVVKAACRADALPSIANDPLTPLGLSINYINAIDGIVMGFTRYLRKLLDHLFTCPRVGDACDNNKQYGIIFYPLILIESISWQILGGVIRFLAAIGIFFFSLFTPPQWVELWVLAARRDGPVQLDQDAVLSPNGRIVLPMSHARPRLRQVRRRARTGHLGEPAVYAAISLQRVLSGAPNPAQPRDGLRGGRHGVHCRLHQLHAQEATQRTRWHQHYQLTLFVRQCVPRRATVQLHFDRVAAAAIQSHRQSGPTRYVHVGAVQQQWNGCNVRAGIVQARRPKVHVQPDQ